MLTEPGVYTLSMAEYLADPCPEPSLSSHIAHELLERSPRHARYIHPRLNPAYRPEQGAVLDLGTLAHRIILEKRTDGLARIEAKDFRTKAAQIARDDARAAGKIPLLESQWLDVQVMVGVWMQQLRNLDPVPFLDGLAERTLLWQDGGVWCRTRPDWMHPGGADDLKTTSTTAHPAEWTRRRLWDSGAALQAALFHRAVKALRLFSAHEASEFRFIVCETDPPYGVSAIALDPEAMAFADMRLGVAIELWRECLASGRWPGYPTRTTYTEVPPWIKVRALEGGYYREAMR